MKWKLLSHVRLFVTPWTILIVHGILQAGILKWVAFPFSRGSCQPRDWTQVSRIASGFFTSWATREAQKARVCKNLYTLNVCFCGLNQKIIPKFSVWHTTDKTLPRIRRHASVDNSNWILFSPKVGHTCFQKKMKAISADLQGSCLLSIKVLSYSSL